MHWNQPRPIDHLAVRRALHSVVAHVGGVMPGSAQEFDCLGRDPRVSEEPHYRPAGIGWTWSSAIAAA